MREKTEMDPVPVPKRPPQERVRDFKEVSLGYSEEQAIREALRCLQCRNRPCVRGCPAEVNIPGFIRKIIEGDFDGACLEIKRTNSLPAVCGRVCPQEEQCQRSCVYAAKGKPIQIGALERFVADRATGRMTEIPAEKKGGDVAVVGSGPAGITCAADLARMGHRVTVFEALHVPGGVLVYGIPEFRLPKEIVSTEVSSLERMGVKFICDFVVGMTETVEDLLNEFDAVFLSNGAGAPEFMGIPGESLKQVYSANEFLTRTNLMKAYLHPEFDTPINTGKTVSVIGAGNVAMDAARTALRLKANEVRIVYRRTRSESPARAEEITNAEEEGVKFEFLTLPVRIIGDSWGNVSGMECVKMRLGERDASGRPGPEVISGSNFTLETDLVINAIGTKANRTALRGAEGIRTNRWGYIEVDPDTCATSMKGVFAGGDVIRGSATVISAIGDGKKAARSIHSYLAGIKNAA
ncbi:MAG: NADPH-dependent glutamate synthase [Candidatus Hadarchaeales archaeon]